ncbi:ORF116 [Betabaculovirus altermyunipunctae]|uniref:ORF116 n=1 Tax=Betabaculovirus altermyunipunctae TaxID=3051996 RepID=A0A1S5YE11_9BBAC|nr:ORF116 [Betabaculovirus altermyunipunctae]AQQ80383.1 ORF116 [Betabaculovirus altermyunipunctae]
MVLTRRVFKDILERVPGLKDSVIATTLKNELQFLVNEHANEKNIDTDTMLDKFVKICTTDNINLDALYNKVKNDLELSKNQFLYLYDCMKNDARISGMIYRLQDANDTDEYWSVPSRVQRTITDADYMYLAKFLRIECNNAAKLNQ